MLVTSCKLTASFAKLMLNMDLKPPRGQYVDYSPRTYRPPPAGPLPRQHEPEKPEPHKEDPPKKTEHKSKPKRPRNLKRWLIITPIVLVLIIGLIWLIHGYISTRNQLEQATKSKPSTTASQQVVDKVALLVDLPAGESPTIATVNDASKVKDQQFFARAKNGDKVLIYSKSGMAVLYRPSTNRVIEYSKVNVSAASQH